jgi:peptidoglycan/xylan/chitin deacetylase (PgdA/CDA1 family)
MDSYSLYYNLPPLSKKVKRLSNCARIGNNTKIINQIVASSPAYIEIGDDVQLNYLKVMKETYVFIEHGVQDMNGLRCDQHCIKTPFNEYMGENIEGNLVTISVDFEAGVALSHAPTESWHYYRSFWDSKVCILRLAELFKRHQIPVTWAICGHLFLDSCTGGHEFEEQDWFGDWFLHDPCTSSQTDPSWYMPDVIEELIKVPYFEIGYHTFGHSRYHFCSEKTVNRDMELADQIRKQWGIKLDSFVFPYNECGYFDQLRAGGFTNIRGNIGRIHPSYGIIDFKGFRFFNTTQMVAPKTMDICRQQLDNLGSHVANYYTHCYQWAEYDSWQELEKWLVQLAMLRDRGKISLQKMNDFSTKVTCYS